jgi:hypothetical protein
MTVSSVVGVPSFSSISQTGSKSECQFTGPVGDKSVLELASETGKRITLVADEVTSIGVKTLVLLASSNQRNIGAGEQLKSGNCVVQASSGASATLTSVDTLAWGSAKQYVMPDGSSVRVIAMNEKK